MLKDERFVQCGASFVINLFFVKSVEKDSVVFRNGLELPLPKNACVSLRAEWLDYWLGGNNDE